MFNGFDYRCVVRFKCHWRCGGIWDEGGCFVVVVVVVL